MSDSSIVDNSTFKKIIDTRIKYVLQENLQLQKKEKKKIEIINGKFSPQIQRSFFNNTMKLFFDKNDYSKNLLNENN